MTTDFDITRIAVTNPAIADAVVVQPREILIDGKAPGTVSLIVWGADGARSSTTSSWTAGVSVAASSTCRRCFPARTSASRVNEEALILSGAGVEQQRHAAGRRDRAASSSGKPKVINMLQLPGGTTASR